FGDSIAGAGIFETKRRNGAGVVGQFVLDVMTDQGAEFEIVGTGHLGEVVFPNEEVFVILPRRLVPKSRISICAPVCWQAHAGRLWENGREFRGNVILECHSCCIRRNYYVVSGARELELVNSSRTQ